MWKRIMTGAVALLVATLALTAPAAATHRVHGSPGNPGTSEHARHVCGGVLAPEAGHVYFCDGFSINAHLLDVEAAHD